MVPYKLERSRRLKRMHVQIDSPDYVLLKMPMRQAERHGLHFLEEHSEWICETLSKQSSAPSLRDHLMTQPRISLCGNWYQLKMEFQQGRCREAVQEAVREVKLVLDSGKPEEEQMVKLLKGIARKYLPERVEYHSERSGIKVHGVTVRDQRSRWGSCSETGGISLNWRLILISPRLQDHVILHELTHLRHFDHSKSFHQMLQSLDGQAKKHARLLDEEASKLINLGRAKR